MEEDTNTALSHSADADHTLILVGTDEAGHHCVCDNHGLMVDNFSTHEEAVCFAFAERERHDGAIVMVTPIRIEH